VFTASATPTLFYQSTIAWRPTNDGWNLTLTDGTTYVFGEDAPLQAIHDRYGNQVTITHANGQSGNVTRVTSPNGRWMAFTYTSDGNNRITQAADNIGRTVVYTYDPNGSGNLLTVTDPESNVTTYTYDTSHRLLTIKDGRQIVYLTNVYTNGRVTQQTLADPNATYAFNYTVDGSGNVTQTDITDPRSHIERLAFNSSHYVTTDTQALGTSLARTTTTTRQVGSNLVTAVVDGLNRRTEYTYNGAGRVLTITPLAGTPSAVTTTFTYEPQFFQLATVTDPLSHTWTIGYDPLGRATSITDPLSNQTTLGYNAAAQVTSVTDPLAHQWRFGYTDGDLTSTTNPLGTMAGQFLDAAGRRIAATDALGRVTRFVFDRLNRVTSVTDPLSGQTTFGYDANSNLLSLTDALTHATGYTYDTSDRVMTRTDPLTHQAVYTYDLNGNPFQITDRKNQVTTYVYDALDRLSQVTFADTATITYTYDTGDRLSPIVDSTNGTIVRTYDDLDHLTGETTAEGAVTYTYDAAGRRKTMNVSGQAVVNYTYDNANQLKTITQGTSTVSLTYDNAGRRSTLTYPNGILATYGYDNANQLTNLTYTLGTSTLGDLRYAYDAAGQRTMVDGSWARTGLPATLTAATYNGGNQLTAWDATQFSYDLNGNLIGDGTTMYSWNARNQLAGLSGGVLANFAYDGAARRRSKTISGTTRFLYDGLNLVQELSSGGSPTANLLTGLGIDETFTRTDGSGARSLLVDALGSTLELADDSGTLQTHYTFEPFGKTTTSGSSSTNALQFAGRENDAGGLYFNRARSYAVGIQRFVSEDLLGANGSANRYAYADERPSQATDPLGLQTLNQSPYPIWYKPEHDEDPKCVPPGAFDPNQTDGIANPWTNPGQVFKHPTGSGIVIAPNGTVTIVVPPPTSDFPAGPPGTEFEGPAPTVALPQIPGASTGVHYPLIPNFPGWGWLPGDWMAANHKDWDPLYRKSLPPEGGRKPPKDCP
jgi:RHS repeat-associated protein